jgi:hypothetical protein
MGMTQAKREALDRLLREATDGIDFGSRFIKVMIKLKMAKENNDGVTLDAAEAATVIEAFQLLKDRRAE